jgi:segregation and condensation protein A
MTLYRPFPLELYAVAEAGNRVLRRPAEAADEAPLARFGPDPPAVAEGAPWRALRRHSASSSTLIAGLVLAKHGDVVLGQEGDFEPIHVASA